MKKVSEHLGQIIVVLAAIALLVCAVVVFRAPLGNFFGNIVDKTTSIGEEVLANMDDVDVTNLNGGNGSGGAGGSGGSGDSGEPGGSGGTSLPEIGGEPDDYSWAEITAISEAGKADEYFQLGDTKTINMGSYGNVVMEIVAFDADTKTSGDTAAITWLSKDLIAKHKMNTESTNVGGWEASELRSWLQTDVYNTLPDEVKNAIVEVNKTYFDYDSAKKITKSCADKVWIPSQREMSSSTKFETSGATYTNYFPDKASRIKYYSGDAAAWWLRSCYGNNMNCFQRIGPSTSNYYSPYSGAMTSLGVALGFCTG